MSTPDPFAPARLGPVDLRNRILKAATFEGMSPKNVVSDLIGKMSTGSATSGNCIHCNKCMVSIYSGTRCVIDHPEPLRIT